MLLTDYPIPPNKSKRGIHGSASCYPEEGHWRDRLALCRDMGISWMKFVDDGGGSGINVYRAAWHEYGIMPIIRFYQSAPGKVGPREADAIKRILDVLGIRAYFEVCNEPDLPIEHPNGKQPKDWLQQAIDAYCIYAQTIIDLGGLPGTFALASGSFGQLRIDEHGNQIPPVKWNFLKAINDKNPGIFQNGGWVAAHNYTLNHPIGYPYDDVNRLGLPLTLAEYNAAPGWAWDNRSLADLNAQRARDKNGPDADIWQDDSCFRAYMIFLAHLKEIGCENVPILTTEGGPCMTDGQDGRYPKVHPVLHAQMIEAIYREIGPIPQYFTYCHWLLYNTTGGWPTACWLDGPQDHSRTIDLLKSTPVGAWGEKFDQQAPPQQPGEPEPPAPPESPAPPLPAVENDASGYGVRIVPAEVTAGETYWRIVRVHHLTGGENNGNHNLYMDVLDRAGRRVNGMALSVAWPGGNARAVIDKPANEPGTNVPLWKGQVVSAVVDDELSSDRIENVHTAHADEPPGNTLFHHSFLVVWQLADAPEPEPPQEPPSEPPVEITDDDIRNAAWNATGIAYVPGNALQEYAKAHGHGRPVTNEIDINDTVRFQAFERMILWCPIGDFLNIHETEWH